MADQGKKKTSQASDPPVEGGKRKAPPTPVYVGGDSIADRLMPHIKQIAAGIGVLALVISAFFTWRWWQRHKAEQATEQVLAAFDDQSRKVVEPGSDATSTATDGGVAEQTFASRTERAEQTLADLGKASGPTREGMALFEADQLLEAGRNDDAATAYRKLSDKPGLDGVLAREGLGFALEAKADGLTADAKTAALTDALAAYQAMQTDEAGPRRDYALYHVGRMQAALGKKDDARTSFESALDKAKEGSDRDLEDLINARLVQLDAPPLPDAPAKPPEKPADQPAPGTGTGSATGAAPK